MAGQMHLIEPTTEPAAPYVVPTVDNVKAILTGIRVQLDPRMVIHLTDPKTGKPLPTSFGNSETPVSKDKLLETTGYPAGVDYAGFLAAGDATGDKAFDDFVGARLQFFSGTMPLFAGVRNKNPYHHFSAPDSLDACGAMGAALIKARRTGVGPDMKPVIDRFADFITHKQFRLDDGTLARHRPFPNSIWADDMYMSVPLLAQLGALTNDTSYYDDAAKQVIQISSRLFIPGSGLYTHGWHEAVGDDQPHYYWARANGWCMMAMVELLDVLPGDHPKRAEIIRQLKAQAQGVASLQARSGLWHQLLDRSDSFEETSASAMFTFAIAKAVNHGWLDVDTYTPVAIAGWNGLTTRIDSGGHVTGTCVGTSYACDYPYYYNRTFTDDQHGYGPVMLAGAEIIKLLKNPDMRSLRVANGTLMVHARLPATAP
jgi:unsaturated rhamnogalacturonyl hydrolase